MKFRLEQRFDFLLPVIVMLSAFLNAFGIWWDQYSNSYYTTAVTSMLQSWRTFFYAALDPAGYITVDKPPVVFWIQTLFARVLGVHGWSVILPQALAGVGSVLLIYYLVRPSFGKTAARLSSLAMACTPIAVAVSRTNNIDSMLVFTLLLATWMLFRGISTQKPPWILGAFAMIGVGFNMKMFEAYMVAPAFYLFYLLAFRSDWKKKLAVLAAATVVLVVVTVSWATIVDAIPQANRPYIGGSQTNSVWELALGYNGIQRLEGMGGPGGGPGGGNAPNRQQGQERGQYDVAANAKVTTNGNNLVKDTTTATTSPAKSSAIYGKAETGPTPGSTNDSQGGMPSFNGGGPGPQGFGAGGGALQGQAPPSGGGGGPWGAGSGGGGGMFHTGNRGPLRLFQSELSDQISWLLPLVGFACLALLAGSRRRKRSETSPPRGVNEGRLWRFKAISDRILFGWRSMGAGQATSGLANIGGARNGTVLQTKGTPVPELLTAKQKETLFWLGWLLPGMAFFSVAGFYHQYYLIMLAPPIAALTGAGWVELWNRYRCRDGWQTWLLPSALLAATAFQLYILKPYWKQIGGGWSISIGVAGIAIALVLALIVVIERIRPVSTRLVAGLAMAGMLVLLAAPLYWSTTPLLYGVNSVMPAAGPGDRVTFGRGSGGGGGGGGSATNDALIEYTTKNNTGASCLFATTDTGTAESYILSGKSVIALGGFNGGDNTINKLKQMVQDKKIKFFLISSGGGGGGGNNDDGVVSWIQAHCSEVPGAEWQSASSQGGQAGAGSGILYKVND